MQGLQSLAAYPLGCHFQSIGIRRLAGPALEGAGEVALVGEAEHAADLDERKLAFTDIPDGEIFAGFFHEFLEADPFFL